MAEAFLSVRELSKRFGGLTAVNRVSLDVVPSAIHGIIGPNGAGKTTLFNVIAGALRPTEGTVLLQGEDVSGEPPHRIAHRHVGRTFQAIELFSDLTVLENVMVGYHARGRAGIVDAIVGSRRQREESRVAAERARRNLEYVGVTGPEGAPATGLSYGHRRLLEIARALMLEPSLLLLDEPAAGMNANERVHLVRLIQRIRAGGVTVVVIEHHMDLVMTVCDTITVLSQGAKIAEGTPAQVRDDPVVMEAYLGVPDDTDAAVH